MEIKVHKSFFKKHHQKKLRFGIYSSLQSPKSQPQKEQSLFVQYFSDKVLHVFILYWRNFLLFHPWLFYYEVKHFLLKHFM